jgi:hypothetical protein
LGIGLTTPPHKTAAVLKPQMLGRPWPGFRLKICRINKKKKAVDCNIKFCVFISINPFACLFVLSGKCCEIPFNVAN